MKHLTFPLLIVLLAGCAPKSEFDISPAQVKTRPIGGPADLAHLPPGAVKHEKVFHKGDVLPDGSISDGDRKVVTVEVNRPGRSEKDETVTSQK